MDLCDVLLEELLTAVKSVQIQQVISNETKEDEFECINANKSVKNLLFCLDRIFLHGLRNKHNGYWNVVCNFCQKDTIQEIMQLQNVSSDIGRGRAWLHWVLNEKLLESFLVTFQHNHLCMKKYYDSFAILTTSKLQLLIDLICGLERISFELSIDTQYMDISSIEIEGTRTSQSAANIPTTKIRPDNVGSTVYIDASSLTKAAVSGSQKVAKSLQSLFKSTSSYVSTKAKPAAHDVFPLKTVHNYYPEEPYEPEIKHYLPPVLDLSPPSVSTEAKASHCEVSDGHVFEPSVPRCNPFNDMSVDQPWDGIPLHSRADLRRHDLEILVADNPIQVEHQQIRKRSKVKTKSKQAQLKMRSKSTQCDEIRLKRHFYSETDSGLISDCEDDGISINSTNSPAAGSWMFRKSDAATVNLKHIPHYGAVQHNEPEKEPAENKETVSPSAGDSRVPGDIRCNHFDHSTRTDPEAQKATTSGVDRLEIALERNNDAVCGNQVSLALSSLVQRDLFVTHPLDDQSTLPAAPFNCSSSLATAVSESRFEGSATEKIVNPCCSTSSVQVAACNTDPYVTSVEGSCRGPGPHATVDESAISDRVEAGNIMCEESPHVEGSSLPADVLSNKVAPPSVDALETHLMFESTSREDLKTPCSVIPQNLPERESEYFTDAESHASQEANTVDEPFMDIYSLSYSDDCHVDLKSEYKSVNENDSSRNSCNNGSNKRTDEQLEELSCSLKSFSEWSSKSTNLSCHGGCAEVDKYGSSDSQSPSLNSELPRDRKSSIDCTESSSQQQLGRACADHMYVAFDKKRTSQPTPSCSAQYEQQVDQPVDRSNSVFVRALPNCVVEIDNNMHLNLMLNILIEEEESIVKLIRVCGESCTWKDHNLMVLFSDSFIYAIKHESGCFMKTACFSYCDVSIEYLCDKQGVCFVSKEKSTCLLRFVAPDQNTSEIIATSFYEGHLTHCERHGKKLLSEICQESKKHRGSLQVCITMEIGAPRDSDISIYLPEVRWRDERSTSAQKVVVKNGHLSYNTGKSFLRRDRWTSAYFVIEDVALYRYKNDSADKADACWLLSRNCTCNHLLDTTSFQLNLTQQKQKLILKASNPREASEWISAFRSIMDPAADMSTPQPSFSLIGSRGHVFIVDEDLDTLFCRAIATLPLNRVKLLQTNSAHTACRLQPFCSECEGARSSCSGDCSAWTLCFHVVAQCSQFVGYVAEQGDIEVEISDSLFHFADSSKR